MKQDKTCSQKIKELLSHVWLVSYPKDDSLPGSSLQVISQARILEWVTISFSRGSSQPRDQACISCMAGRFFTTDQPGKPHNYTYIHTQTHTRTHVYYRCAVYLWHNNILRCWKEILYTHTHYSLLVRIRHNYIILYTDIQTHTDIYTSK